MEEVKIENVAEEAIKIEEVKDNDSKIKKRI